jgi:myo-inositol-1(or 4)-monophosphatase
LLVREAGGVYNDFAGREGLPENGNIIAANHKVAAAMTEVIGANATPRLLGV